MNVHAIGAMPMHNCQMRNAATIKPAMRHFQKQVNRFGYLLISGIVFWVPS